MADLIHYPEEDKGEDVPKESYVKLEGKKKFFEFKEGAKERTWSERPAQYYVAIGRRRFDQIGGTGAAAVLQAIRQFEKKGDRVVGYGNFPDTPFYREVIARLKRETRLSLTDPSSELREAVRRQEGSEKGKKGKKDEQVEKS